MGLHDDLNGKLAASLERERLLRESLDRAITTLSAIACGDMPLRDVMGQAMERARVEMPMLDVPPPGDTPDAKAIPNARPMCEECDEPMHPYTLTVNGVSGWACDSCGWSWDDTPAAPKGGAK